MGEVGERKAGRLSRAEREMDSDVIVKIGGQTDNDALGLTNRDAGINANNDAVRMRNRDAGRNGNNDAVKTADRNMDNDASGFSILYTNAQSIVNKVEELRALAAINDPDILILTETWTNEAISNEYLNVNGYEIIERRDRNDTDRGRGGGIIVYVRKNMHAWREDCDTSFNQCAMVKLKRHIGELCMIIVYRSPNSTKTNDEELCKWVDKQRGNYIIIGDFNFPDIRWEAGCAGAKGRKFLETVNDRFLTQHVQFATHDSGNTLDLILSSQDDLVRNVEPMGKIGKSDHVMMRCKVQLDAVRSNNAQMYRDFYKADHKEMRRTMKKNWPMLLDGKDANQIWSVIKESLKMAIDIHVPLRKRKRTDEPKWLDAELRKKIGEKRKAWSEWKRTGRETDRVLYRNTERTTKRMIRNKKNALERDIAKNRKTNPKKYFSYVNSSKRNKSRIGPLRNDSGEFIINPKDKAEAMNDFFKSVFTHSDGESPAKTAINGDKFLEDVEVTKERVKNLIDRMRENSAAGPDGLPPIILKILRDEISEPLAILFRRSIDDGRIPDEWRDAHITAIHKKGSKSEPGNYRGVSLTSVVGKLLERLVKAEIDSHVEGNALMSSTQHGFRTGRSTRTNLIKFLNETTKWNDDGYCFDVIYLDFSKAFDVVCHKRLLVKLRAIGISGKVLAWIEDWLSNRRQKVIVEGESSEWASVESSVLQGSVLGGILFNIFVDDIDEAIIKALLKKFADDTKLAKIIKDIADALEMQENLDRLCRWADKWKMAFNASKCKVIHYGKKNIRFQYKLNGNVIESVCEEKDLGVWMEDDLKPTKQCRMAAQSANWALGQLTRAFHFRKASCLVPLYKTFVRPKLEHAVAAWSPWMEGDRETIERVQKRMIRYISDKSGATYEERLASVGLTTMVERRERGDMIETFRTIYGFNNVDRNQWFDFRNATNARATRSTVTVSGNEQHDHDDVLYMGNVRLEIRKNFFTVRVIKKWNEIPERVRRQRSVDAFKNNYDEWRQTEKRRQQQQQQQT